MAIHFGSFWVFVSFVFSALFGFGFYEGMPVLVGVCLHYYWRMSRYFQVGFGKLKRC